MVVILFSLSFLLIGFFGGWFVAEKYIALIQHERHGFEELFEENPHPEIFKQDGTIDRGDYMVMNFEPGYDPDEFDPEDLAEY